MTATAKASSHRGDADAFSPQMAIDQNPETYWATDDAVRTAHIEIDLGKPQTVKYIQLQEYIKLGQRVKSFQVEALGWNSLESSGKCHYNWLQTYSKIRTDGDEHTQGYDS